jgi:hypothetical protein
MAAVLFRIGASIRCDLEFLTLNDIVLPNDFIRQVIPFFVRGCVPVRVCGLGDSVGRGSVYRYFVHFADPATRTPFSRAPERIGEAQESGTVSRAATRVFSP